MILKIFRCLELENNVKNTIIFRKMIILPVPFVSKYIILNFCTVKSQTGKKNRISFERS